MWEALMMLRLMASLSPPIRPGARTGTPGLPAGRFKGAIRLSFAACSLSLPIPSAYASSYERKQAKEPCFAPAVPVAKAARPGA